MTRRVLYALVGGVILATLTPSTAFGQKPTTSCPAEASGWFLVDRDEWWENTVAGFELEGIEVYDEFDNFTTEFEEFAVAFGFDSGAALEEFVRFEQWAVIDKNENDLLCMKVLPQTPGIAGYFFGGIDDSASSPHGESEQ